MPQKVKLALIGAGAMANSVHYPSLAGFDDVQLVGLCDLIPDKLHETAERFEIDDTYADYRRMLEEQDPDGVYVLMPPHQLYDIVAHVLQQGLHLFIEKPPGVYSEQTRQMANLADRHDCISMVGFNRRYIPLMQQCKQRVIDHGGPIIQAMASFYKWFTGAPYYNGAVDILTSDCIHAVDTLRFIAGDVAKLASEIDYQNMHYATRFNAIMQFESGAAGILMGNWRVGTRIHRFEMHSEAVSAYVNPNFEATIYADGADEPERITTQQAAGGSDQFRVYYGFEAENRAFVDAIKANQQPETCLSDAVKTMELVDRIYHCTL